MTEPAYCPQGVEAQSVNECADLRLRAVTPDMAEAGIRALRLRLNLNNNDLVLAEAVESVFRDMAIASHYPRCVIRSDETVPLPFGLDRPVFNRALKAIAAWQDSAYPDDGALVSALFQIFHHLD